MRPGVHASVLRTTRQTSHRVHDKNAPEFSFRKLIVLVILGLTLLVPGAGLTIVGFKPSEDLDANTASSQSMYRVIGPIGCVSGTLLILAAIFYYWCYGTAEARRAHAHRHKALMHQKTGSISHTLVGSGLSKSASPHHQHSQSHPHSRSHHSHHSHGHRRDQYLHDGSIGDSHIQPMLPLTEENLQQFNNHQQNLHQHVNDNHHQHHHVIIVTDDHGVPEKLSDQQFDFSQKVEAPIAPEETMDVSMTTDDGAESAEILNC